MSSENNTNQNNDNDSTNKFDEAFNKSSKITQDYILSEKFEENIKLICKIEKLDDEKSNIIIENLAVSILIGILPIGEAKTMLTDSFKSSGILIEDFTASSIIKLALLINVISFYSFEIAKLAKLGRDPITPLRKLIFFINISFSLLSVFLISHIL